MASASVIIPIVYLSLPIAAIGLAAIRARHTRDPNPLRETLVTFILGIVGGLILAACYMRQAIAPADPGITPHESSLPLSEIAIACYWGIAVACVLRGVNAVLRFGIGRLLPARTPQRGYSRSRDISGSILRSALLFAFAIPYVVGMVLVWRPHFVTGGTPVSVLGKNFQNVSFVTSDGLTIRGWWIPGSSDQSSADGHAVPVPSERTIILCHDFNADKVADLSLARDLAPGDFNILAFDFRGHGQSEGQLCTFGDLERRDVLAAVKWVRQNHPNESRKIYGLGVGLGSAALIAAAADPDQGQAIDAIAVFAPYDRVTTMLQGVANVNFVPTVGWIATHISLPMMGAQLGRPLSHFAPGDYVDQIAPRPLLVIASGQDENIDVSLSQDLFEKASQPKYAYWIKKGTRDRMLFKNEKASHSLRFFFETARSVL